MIDTTSAQCSPSAAQNVEVLLESIMDAAEVLERSNEEGKVSLFLIRSLLRPRATTSLPSLLLLFRFFGILVM